MNTALRAIGVLGAGREPRTADATDALNALRNLYPAWVASGAFGRIEDIVPTGTTYVSSGQERIFRLGPNPLSVTLPTLVGDDGREDYGRRSRYYGTIIEITTSGNVTTVDVRTSQPIGQATPPRDGSVVVISDEVGGETRHWIYDGTTKRWQSPEAMLTLDDDAPRSTDYLGLAACLVMEIADNYGRDVGALTLRQARRYEAALTQRLGMRREAVAGVFF